MTVCLLEELILSLSGADTWLPAVKQNSILPCLLTSLPAWIQTGQGVQYVNTVMLFLQTLAKSPEGAEAVAVNGITQHLCLVVASLYDMDNTIHNIGATSTIVTVKQTDTPSWHSVYCHYMGVMTLMLSKLRYNFLQDALDFMGVHQDRIYQCLESVRLNLSLASLTEAEETARFLHQMAHYRREWRLHLPEVLNKLMVRISYILVY